MIKRLIVYGLLAICAAWVLTTKAQRPQREEIEILIVANPINPLNPVVRNPYQTEYEQMLYPTVRITAGFATGSGVIIPLSPPLLKGETGGFYILTAAHVVENETTVDIELYDATIIAATVVITDTIRDLALLKPTGLVSYSAQMAPRKYTPYLFTPVWAIGCSLGLPPRPSSGIITAINIDSWEISAPILPGNSGGPVFDGRTYEVIGIAVWVKTYQGQLITTMAGVVPINQIYQFLDSHRDTEVIEKH